MSSNLRHSIRNNSFWLSAGRYIYWEEEQAIIASDLHFGKTGHFRKAGIPVPQSVYKEDLQRLIAAMQYYQPRQLVIVGDLFHSSSNKEMDWFLRWRQDFSHIGFNLIKGNHDILDSHWYSNAGITVFPEQHTIGAFTFVHDLPNTTATASHYTFSGHLHPGVRIEGMGKQTLRFPCYYFGEQFAVLPAFSHFTGLACIRPSGNDRMFAIVNQSVIAV
jgi:DNA ligase-associated metallophosphoesterase